MKRSKEEKQQLIGLIFFIALFLAIVLMAILSKDPEFTLLTKLLCVGICAGMIGLLLDFYKSKLNNK